MTIPYGSTANGPWQTLKPTTEWQTMKTPINDAAFTVPTDAYYIGVEKK